MKSALIVGGSGYLGNRLAGYLESAGVRVTCIDPGAVPPGHVCTRHLTTTADEVPAESLGDIDTVYLLAWAGVAAPYRWDFDRQFSNVHQTVAGLELARAVRAGRIVWMGSVSEVALNATVITPDTLPAPVDAYGVAKAACRLVLRTIAQRDRLPLITTIVGSIYGPGRDDGNVLTYAITSLLRGERPTFTDLKQAWDYLYVDDLVGALAALGERGVVGRNYVVASGTSRPLGDYIRAARDLINPAAELGIGERPRPMGTRDQAAQDISALVADTGFEPRTLFADGLRATVDYFRRLPGVSTPDAEASLLNRLVEGT